jgi:hypothetical protein
VSISSVHPFAQAPNANTHEVSPVEAKLTATASGKWIETDSITDSNRIDGGAYLGHIAGAVGAEYVRHRYGNSGGAHPGPDIDVVDCRALQLNDYVRWRG